MNLQRHAGAKFGELIGTIFMATLSCGGKVLNLGRDVEPPRYATPDTVDGEGKGAGIPTSVASHQYGADQLVLDDTRIYWTTVQHAPQWRPELDRESCVVRSCARADCASSLVTYASLSCNQPRIAVNRSAIYWNTWNRDNRSDSVVACPIAGCDGPPTTVATDVLVTSLVADDQFVYWLSSDSTLLKCEVDGCRSRTLLTHTKHLQHGPGVLALDATRLYWLDRENNTGATGLIKTVPKNGSAPAQILAASLHQPQSIALDERNIYWTESYALGTVKSCPLTGCVGEPTVLASEQPFPALLSIFGDRAYWATSETGRIYWGADPQGATARLVECPLSGCGSAPTLLSSGQPGVGATGVDRTHVYWTLYGELIIAPGLGQYHDGGVKRVRRR